MTRRSLGAGTACLSVFFAACGTTGPGPVAGVAPSGGMALGACTELPDRYFALQADFTAELVPAGTLTIAGNPVAEHCRVAGQMHERVSPVDGRTYAIGFEMRLPRNWNGRFFYQGNGGIDGAVVPALGAVSGGGPLTHALAQGFAVLSSDAGHAPHQNPLFGLDPVARLDYGYQAVGKLTPMAKGLIRHAYGAAPHHSYIGGCSNGGRHAMVAAARYPDQYDGFLAGNPGFNLPQAAVAQLYGAQQYARVATSEDLATAFTPDERRLVADRVLARCDALDGLADGMVQATAACQRTFSLERDVPTCTDGRTGTCLSAEQKTVLGNIFRGAHDSRGNRLYASFPFDAGIPGADWASWKFVASVTNRDPVAMAFIFQTPPASPDMLRDTRAFALGFDMDRDAPKIFATAAPYDESGMSFMTPPDVQRLDSLRRSGGKLLVYHGTSDPVFSSDDTAAWYDALSANHRGDAATFARYFQVPGMNHCRGGPATDQFDMLTALVDWVENGQAPDRITASARGPGNPGGVNAELPADWAADRTRPLCAWPSIARYDGTGDPERASSFRCELP